MSDEDRSMFACQWSLHDSECRGIGKSHGQRASYKVVIQNKMVEAA